MIVDPAVVPGFLLLLVEFVALAAVGFIVVRVALRQTDDRMALAQGMVVGLALWGLITNFVLYAVPGLAGAAVGWGVTLMLGAVLAWRAPRPLGLQPRTAAGFVLLVLALFLVALASRQQVTIPDPHSHLGLAASLRAGGFPPEMAWNPGMPAHFHHGAYLLIGLLAPPAGPDLAFVHELLSVYAWASAVLVVVTALVARGSWQSALLLTPLLLTAGLWTWTAQRSRHRADRRPRGAAGGRTARLVGRNLLARGGTDLGSRRKRRSQTSGSPPSRWHMRWLSWCWSARHGPKAGPGRQASRSRGWLGGSDWWPRPWRP